MVHIGTETSSWEAEIYLQGNGILTQLADNDVGGTFPDINDHGTIVQQRWDESFSTAQVMMPQDGEPIVLTGEDLVSPT